jgi:hypothetical protein
VFLDLETKQTLIFFQDSQRIARFALGDLATDNRDFLPVDTPVGKARLEKLLGKLAGIFVELHGAF